MVCSRGGTKNTLLHETLGGNRHGNGSSGSRDKGDPTRTWQLCLLCAKKEKVALSYCFTDSQTEFRFCKMSVKPGAQYCGEHSPIPITEQDLGRLQTLLRSGFLKLMTSGNKPISELRVPCPYDPKHTCFASKMEKHLKICNSKVTFDVHELDLRIY